MAREMSSSLVLFLVFLTLHLGNCLDSSHDNNCTVDVLQKASLDCQKSREKELAIKKLGLQLESILSPIPVLKLSPREVYYYFLKDSFNRNHTKLFVFMTKNKNLGLRKMWLQNHPLDVTRFKTYYDIFNFFRNGQSKPPFQNFFHLPSKSEPFVDITRNWRRDRMFAEQRLAGNNPMALRRVVTDAESVGIKWSELQKVLNPNFNWERAIKRTSGRKSFKRALQHGAVYALRYELFDGLKSMPDINETRSYRHMRPVKSTIGLFVVRRGRLKPVAIQMDYKKDSPVYTPRDSRSKWLLAKLSLQETDGYYSQVVEHLVKTHQITEPICVCMHRHLSKKHPLNQLLKFHCRGTMIVNAIGGPTLVTKGNYVHQMYAAGYLGTRELIQRKQKTVNWNELDFFEDLKRRGVDDKKALAYYPFRDDGRVIHHAISRMVKDYVNLYYKSDCDILYDKELQAFTNEISADGTGPDGGNGKTKDFPATITSKKLLINTLTRVIWMVTAQHSAVNYPTSDYSALVTCVPTKLYDDDRSSLLAFNFPNAYIATTQAVVAMNIGVLRYDRLFGYGAELEDKRAGQVLQKHYLYLEKQVTPLIKRRNRIRWFNRRLTYPYFLPRWIPNSIQT